MKRRGEQRAGMSIDEDQGGGAEAPSCPLLFCEQKPSMSGVLVSERRFDENLDDLRRCCSGKEKTGKEGKER